MRFTNVNAATAAAIFAALAVQQVVAENCWCGREIYTYEGTDTLTARHNINNVVAKRSSRPLAKRTPRDLTAPGTDPNNPANQCTRPMPPSIHYELVGKPEYCLGDIWGQLCCDDCSEYPPLIHARTQPAHN